MGFVFDEQRGPLCPTLVEPFLHRYPFFHFPCLSLKPAAEPIIHNVFVHFGSALRL